MLNKLLVCLTGMPGAGKSTIADGLKPKGYEIINLGNAVREEAKKRNLDPTRENLGKLMLELRENNGAGAIAEPNSTIPYEFIYICRRSTAKTFCEAEYDDDTTGDVEFLRRVHWGRFGHISLSIYNEKTNTYTE